MWIGKGKHGIWKAFTGKKITGNFSEGKIPEMLLFYFVWKLTVSMKKDSKYHLSGKKYEIQLQIIVQYGKKCKGSTHQILELKGKVCVEKTPLLKGLY